MPVTITVKGSDFKVDEGTEINYYPIDDIQQRSIGTTVELLLNGDLVKSFKEGDFVSPTGTAEEISDEISNMSSIATGDFSVDVSQGKIENHSIIIVAGRNIDVGTSLVDIGMENTIFDWINSAVKLEAISDDAADDAAGAGARIICIKGLDDNFDQIEELVTMNGLSATVETTLSFRRVNKVEVVTSGTFATSSGGSNVGSITIRESGAGNTAAFISNDLLGSGRSQDARYTIPRGHEAVVLGVGLNVSSSKIGKLLFQVRPAADIVAAPFSPRLVTTIIDGESGRHSVPESELKSTVKEKTDIWASSIATGVNTEASVRIVLMLIDKR